MLLCCMVDVKMEKSPCQTGDFFLIRNIPFRISHDFQRLRPKYSSMEVRDQILYL
jgi:hypothetical protein